MEALILPFLTILIAEFLDKSQLSLFLLATRTKRPLQLLFGAMLGFLVVDGIAVFFGAWITSVISGDVLSIIAGCIFIIFGILTFRNAKTDPKEAKMTKYPFLASFLTILFVEWGDKSQLATALFATQYPPHIVLTGVLLALFLLTILAITVGKLFMTRLEKKPLNIVAGIAFIVLGITFLFFK